MTCNYYSYNLAFRHPFTISRGTKTHQPTLIVQLSHNGLTGYGEAPAISYYHIPVEKMIADLEAKRPMIERFALTDPERYWHYLHHLLPGQPLLVCALDIAGWDLYGQTRGEPLYKLWRLDPAKAPLTDYTIGIDTIEKMVEKMKEFPWPIYKIKLGTSEDLAIVAALRAHTRRGPPGGRQRRLDPGRSVQKRSRVSRRTGRGVRRAAAGKGRPRWHGQRYSANLRFP